MLHCGQNQVRDTQAGLGTFKSQFVVFEKKQNFLIAAAVFANTLNLTNKGQSATV